MLPTKDSSIIFKNPALGYIGEVKLIIARTKYTINKPFKSPYTSPPTSLHCFRNGRFAIPSNSALANIKAILATMYNTNITAAFIIVLVSSVDTTSATFAKLSCTFIKSVLN